MSYLFILSQKSCTGVAENHGFTITQAGMMNKLTDYSKTTLLTLNIFPLENVHRIYKTMLNFFSMQTLSNPDSVYVQTGYT